MSLKIKKRFKNFGRIIGIALFIFMMFTNIKLAITNEAELSYSNFTIFGVEISLQDNTYAKKRRLGMCGDICYITQNEVCTYISGYGYCSGRMG